MLTVMAAFPHSIPTIHAESYAGQYSLHSNRPCWPLCRPILPHFQPAVLTVMPDHLDSIPPGRANRYAVPSSLHSKRPCRQLCRTLSFHFNRPRRPLCRTILTPRMPAVLAVILAPPHSFPTGLAHPFAGQMHSLQTIRADRYAGPFSLHSNRPC